MNCEQVAGQPYLISLCILYFVFVDDWHHLGHVSVCQRAVKAGRIQATPPWLNHLFTLLALSFLLSLLPGNNKPTFVELWLREVREKYNEKFWFFWGWGGDQTFWTKVTKGIPLRIVWRIYATSGLLTLGKSFIAMLPLPGSRDNKPVNFICILYAMRDHKCGWRCKKTMLYINCDVAFVGL